MYTLLRLTPGSILVLIFSCLISTGILADEVTRDQIKGLDEQVQDIKKDVLNLNSELSRLEEKLLYPSNTQVSVFVSMHKGDNFRLDSVQLRVDEKVVAQHIYSYRELEALHKGGVQKLYTGNVKTGDHAIEFDLIGAATSGGKITRRGTYSLSKEVGPKFVEVKIAGPDSNEESIQFRDW
jgi:hypothetical protein